MRPFVQRLVLAAAVLAATLASAAAQDPAKVESAYANLPNGVKLHYLVAGEGGTPVIAACNIWRTRCEVTPSARARS